MRNSPWHRPRQLARRTLLNFSVINLALVPAALTFSGELGSFPWWLEGVVALIALLIALLAAPSDLQPPGPP